MRTVTMRCNADAPVSWVAAASFNMEHAITLLAIGQHEWPEDTTPRTDSPVRFSWHFDAHNGGKVQAWTEPYSWEV